MFRKYILYKEFWPIIVIVIAFIVIVEWFQHSVSYDQLEHDSFQHSSGKQNIMKGSSQSTRVTYADDSAILQRVLSASVTVDKQLVSSIGKGILVLAAVAPNDTEKDVETLANKVLKLKLWDDETGGR